MKSYTHTIIALICLWIGCILVCSCANSADLAPGGVYNGDATLYNADKVIVGSYAVFDTFVKWEYTNRPLLVSNPAIRKSADNVRQNAPGWIASATALRDAYALNPTTDGKTKLMAALNVLQVALNEIATYYVANMKPPTPTSYLEPKTAPRWAFTDPPISTRYAYASNPAF